jgi:hypothetical protein
VSSRTQELIVEIEEEALDPAMAARALRSAALDLLNEVNRLERAYPQSFLDLSGREWHIARYEHGAKP